MNTANKSYIATGAILAVFAGAIICIADEFPQSVGTESGSATFHSGTNVSGIEIKGISNALAASADVVKDTDKLIIKRVDASLPVKSLLTGMKIRDEHMRKYIFTTSDGHEPDLHFTADEGSCPATGPGFSCALSGNLSIRGIARSLTLNLKVKEQTGSSVFRVAGDGVVKLSDYGIDPPSQFGVKPLNQVEIHLDFTGKRKNVETARAGGQ
jgi:polyisoprenoid-binding protein YceI